MHLRRTAVVAACVLLGTTTVALAKKPKVAVLGLEVVDDAGMDATIAKFATGLTDALRKRAQVGAGPFRLAPNSNKDLLEMKLLGGCANEARSCMADIGKDLKADKVIYGKIEQRKDGYQVTIKLLDVAGQNLERSTTELIALDDTSPARINEWARRLYNRLTGVPDQGTLTVIANVQTGTVYVNDEVKGGLVDGRANIQGLPEGIIELRVESEGYAPYSSEVTVKGGGTTEVETNLASLDAVGGKKPGSGKPGGTSRMLFWTSAVVTGAGAAGFAVTGIEIKGKLENEKKDAIVAYQDATSDQLSLGDACGDASAKQDGLSGMDRALIDAVVSACDKGKSRQNLNWALAGVTIVGAAAAGFFYYKGYIQPKSATNRETASRKTRRAPAVVVTPAVSPSYVGAGVHIEF